MRRFVQDEGAFTGAAPRTELKLRPYIGARSS